jgi:type II secretory pathway pseudopilin PulG
MRSASRSSTAFSLTEVLLATSIAAITGVAVFSMFTTSRQIQFATKSDLLATYFARATMEHFRSRPFSQIATGHFVDPIPPTAVFSKDLNALREYDTVVRLEGGVPVGYTTTVTVSWDALELAPGARSEIRLVLFRTNSRPLGWSP